MQEMSPYNIKVAFDWAQLDLFHLEVLRTLPAEHPMKFPLR